METESMLVAGDPLLVQVRGLDVKEVNLMLEEGLDTLPRGLIAFR